MFFIKSPFSKKLNITALDSENWTFFETHEIHFNWIHTYIKQVLWILVTKNFKRTLQLVENSKWIWIPSNYFLMIHLAFAKLWGMTSFLCWLSSKMKQDKYVYNMKSTTAFIMDVIQYQDLKWFDSCFHSSVHSKKLSPIFVSRDTMTIYNYK